MLGQFFRQLRGASGFFRILFFLVLALLVVLAFFIRPAHPHFTLEAVVPGFWAGFGLIGAVVMVLVMKKLAQPLIARSEDVYDR